MDYRGLTFDLSLDDFQDEDLSEIIKDDKSKLHSYANDNFKLNKRKRNKKLARPVSMNEVGSKSQQSVTPRPRPQTLRFFTAPLRPGPLAPNTSCQKTTRGKSEELKQEKTETSRLKHTYSDDTIKNNNIVNNTNNCNKTNEMEKCRNVEISKPKLNHSTSEYSRSNTSEDIVNLTTIRRHRCSGLTRSASEWSIEDPDKIEYCYMNGELKEQTHSALFKFVPRHRDEIQLEVNDPLCVENQADDFWYEGINMRSGDRGAFPAYYARSLVDESDDLSELSVRDETCEKFNLYFLGSVEVTSHKGNDVLCHAMHEIAQSRRRTLHTTPPAYVCLLVNHHGIKMMDQSLMKKHATSSSDVSFSSSSKVKEQTHFFQLRNVSFCGHHPRNDKYFAFITRHPDSASRFACHAFVSEASTRPVAESVGRAFSAFYREFLECQHPVEDIYIE